ncbi:MAG: Hsp20/alpha crystallin family protein [Gaiellaceae bacterium]
MATLVRWEPLREAAALQSEMSRMMSSVFAGQGNGQTSDWVPAVDVWETEKEIVYVFDLPGIPQDKISLEFEDGALTVSGERERTKQQSDERYYRSERRFGSFSRTIGAGSLGAGRQGRLCRRRAAGARHEAQAPKPRRIQIGGEQATIEGKATKS